MYKQIFLSFSILSITPLRVITFSRKPAEPILPLSVCYLKGVDLPLSLLPVFAAMLFIGIEEEGLAPPLEDALTSGHQYFGHDASAGNAHAPLA